MPRAVLRPTGWTRAQAPRGNVSALAADWWPLEMAVTWVACDRQTTIEAAAFALERRHSPDQRHPSLGMWLTIRAGLAQRLEAVDGAFYRKERREGWAPGRTGSPGAHPIISAIKETARRMTVANINATGCYGNSPRSRIPRQAWKSAAILDDRKLGLILKAPNELPAAAWRQINVRAEPFKQLGAKRGRRPAGLSDGARLPPLGVKTRERLRAKEILRKKPEGSVRASRGRGGGRPAGRRDRH
jgi:hypothetical protein